MQAPTTHGEVTPFNRVFLFYPVKTRDCGWKWLTYAWRRYRSKVERYPDSTGADVKRYVWKAEFYFSSDFRAANN